MVSHPSEASNGSDPGAGQRRDVQSVASVMRNVVKINESGFGEVIVSEVEMSDLSGDDRLRTGGE